MRCEHGRCRRAARSGDHPCHRIDDVFLFKSGISDRLPHGDIGIGRTRAHEAQCALVDMFRNIQVNRTRDLRAEPVFGHVFIECDAGFARFERSQHL